MYFDFDLARKELTDDGLNDIAYFMRHAIPLEAFESFFSSVAPFLKSLNLGTTWKYRCF